MKSSLSYVPLVAGFLVLVLSLAVGVLTVSSRQSVSISTKAVTENASLSLTPATGEYAFSSVIPVGIIVDSSGKAIDGVDVIINFDPKKVKVLDNKIAGANFFENIPVNNVDNVAGKITFSGLTFSPKPVTGIIGTFRFQPLVKGEVDFAFNFTLGSTTDSNIAGSETAKDILGSAPGAKFVFK